MFTKIPIILISMNPMIGLSTHIITVNVLNNDIIKKNKKSKNHIRESSYLFSQVLFFSLMNHVTWVDTLLNVWEEISKYSGYHALLRQGNPSLNT
jgi:hypothetical protein